MSPLQRLLVATGWVVLLTLHGCAVVQVSQRNTAQSLIEQRDSILTRNRLSEASIGLLSMIGHSQTSCLQQIEACLQQLKQTTQSRSEQYLATASELYLLNADQFLATKPDCQALPIIAEQPHQIIIIRLKKDPHTATQYDDAPVTHCQQQRQNALLNSIRYAYAYLFASERPPQQRLFDNRQVQVRDFYNVAVSRFIAEQFNGQHEPVSGQIQLTQPNHQTVSININDHGQLFKQQAPEQLVAADELSFSGLRTVNRRDGFGVEFVAVMPKPVANPTLTPTEIYPSRYLPISLVMQPTGQSAEEMTLASTFTLDIYNPYQQAQTKPLSQSAPQNLAANFSAPYGLWLAQNNMVEAAYRSLLALDEKNTVPKLYLLEPYQPTKRVIILLHGLAGSPETWVSLTNDVLGDPDLRQGYQVWQVFYPTNMPMLESRLRIQQLIEQTYQQVDPKQHDAASRHSVLIGHSMGGVISRLMVSPTDLSQAAFSELNPQERQRLLRIDEIKHYFQLKPLAQVDRAVFVSAPFRGTDYADRWFTLALRKIIQLPASFLRSIEDALTREKIDEQLMQRISAAGLLDFQNGASELSQHSRFMRMTEQVKIKAGLPYHLIIGQLDPKTSITDSSDGIVPYYSSHLNGASSERLIQGGHSIQSTPEAVLELRRILREHLHQIGDLPTDANVMDTRPNH